MSDYRVIFSINVCLALNLVFLLTITIITYFIISFYYKYIFISYINYRKYIKSLLDKHLYYTFLFYTKDINAYLYNNFEVDWNDFIHSILLRIVL